MSPRWLHWPAAAAGVDWDTYEDGIWKISSLSGTRSGAFVRTSTNFPYPTSQGFETDSDRLVGAPFPTINDAPPYIALWNHTDQLWITDTAAPRRSSLASSSRAFYDDGGSFEIDGITHGYASLTSMVGDEIYLIYLTQDPGSITGWRDYDGPTS